MAAEHKVKLHGHPQSTCTRRVLCVLHEKNIPFDFDVVDLTKGAHKSPEFLKLQPWGQIPVVELDGFKLYESRAIMRYLDGKFGGQKLTPAKLEDAATMEQELSVEASNITPHLVTIIRERIWIPLFYGGKTNEKNVEDGAKALEKALGVMNEGLNGKDFVAGSQFTLADVAHLPQFELLSTLPEKAIIDKFPNVVAWWKRCSGRPSWQKAIGK